MKTKPLSKTNPYLKDATLRQKLNEQAARSSCGVEGIDVTTMSTTIKIKRREKRLFKKLQAKLSSD